MERQQLEDALTSFNQLLLDDSADEADFQEWFEEYTIIFRAYGYQRVINHPELRNENTHHIPDFMVQRLDGLWEIFELKRPDTKVLKDAKKRQTFYSSLEEYYAQCREYSEFFEEAGNRQAFNEKYSANIQKSVPAILVAGRSHGVDTRKVHGILFDRGSKIQHQMYDDIRNRLEFYRANLYSKYENNLGISIHMIVIPQKLRNDNNFIIDIGTSTDKDRVSIFINARDELCFRVIDSYGESYVNKNRRGKNEFGYDRILYLTFELGIGVDYSFLAIEVNGKHFIDSRINNLDLIVDAGENYVLGSDVLGQAKTEMSLVELAVYSRTLTFEDKSSLRAYFLGKYMEYFINPTSLPARVVFSGNQFMYSQNHPNFTQNP